MTAEIAVLNREAVALAADSAATIRTGAGPKVFNSVTKIFGLSTVEPVGIMIYGQASLLGVPWGTIVKAYRDARRDQSHEQLADYLADFVSFLEQSSDLFPREAQDEWAELIVRGFFTYLETGILERLRAHLDDVGKITKGEVKAIVRELIAEHHAEWRDAEPTDGSLAGAEDKAKRRLTKITSKARREVFDKAPVTSDIARKLSDLAVWLFTKRPPPGRKSPTTSGIVVAGFGAREHFPHLSNLAIEGLYLGAAKYAASEDIEINRNDNTAVIAPFAQRESVQAFMEGIHPRFEYAYLTELIDLLDAYPAAVLEDARISASTRRKVLRAFEARKDKQLDDISARLDTHRAQEHVAPVIEVVGVLPKDELAMMAESLVSLTSFRHRISFGAESVGGPIDVAVISKGDGFVWINRKYYFRRELNPQFYASKYGGIDASA